MSIMAAALAVALLGCGSSKTAATPAFAERTATPTGTQDSPPIATATPPTAGASAGPLASRSVGAFKIPFSVAESGMAAWRQHLDTPTWVYLGHRSAANEDDEGISIHALDNLAAKPACGTFESGASWEPWTGIGGAAAFMRWLVAALPSVKPTDVTVAGRSGKAADVSTADFGSCGDVLWITRTLPDNALGLMRSSRNRLIALDVDGAVLLFVVGSADPTRFENVWSDAQAFFAAVTFLGPGQS